MRLWEAILLALALCVDSLVVATSCALKNKMSYHRGALLAITFAACQGGFPLLGALLGETFHDVIAAVDHWIAFALLSLVGVKMILDALHGDGNNDRMDVSRYWVIVTLAVATSIDAFVVGIGFGLNSTLPQVLYTCLIITIVTFFAAMTGIFLGKRNIPIPDKWAGTIAGIVLIGLGVKTLFEHGVFG